MAGCTRPFLLQMKKKLSAYLGALTKGSMNSADSLLRGAMSDLEEWEKLFAIGARLHISGDLGAAESFIGEPAQILELRDSLTRTSEKFLTHQDGIVKLQNTLRERSRICPPI